MWTILKVFIEFVTTLFLFWCFGWELCGILTLQPGIDHAPIWETEKEMATHSSTLAWKIPWTEEPGRLQSMESKRVGHNWEISLFTIWEMNHLTPMGLEHLLILFAFLLLSLTFPHACGLFIPGEQEKHIVTNHNFLFTYGLYQNLKCEIKRTTFFQLNTHPSPSSDFLLSEKHCLCPEFKISMMSLKS